MSEWWTYRLHDFLLFSARTYYRLFEIYNRAVWPLHVLAIAAGIAILIGRLRGRALAVFLAADWLFIAWFFQIKRYATIQWAAKWFALAFAIEALLLIFFGFRRITQTSKCGLVLFGFALLIEPLIGLMTGRRWVTVEIFGIAPDPTAIATLGIALFADRRLGAVLMIIPMLWCAISGATLWAMHAPDAIVLLVTPAIALACHLRNRARHVD